MDTWKPFGDHDPTPLSPSFQPPPDPPPWKPFGSDGIPPKPTPIQTWSKDFAKMQPPWKPFGDPAAR